MVQTDIATMGRDDSSLRYRFSQALRSVIPSDISLAIQGKKSFDDPLFRDRVLVSRYSQLLCTLTRDPTWHGQLQRSGHFGNCLYMADTIRLSQNQGFSNSCNNDAVCITHIFATIDALGEEHPVLEDVHEYSSWPLILQAWNYIFRFDFFEDATPENWKYIASTGHLEALPSIVAYAMKYWEQWDNTEETVRLIRLVQHVCDKLDEEKHRSDHDLTLIHRQLEDNDSFGHRRIPDMIEQIRALLWILSRDLFTPRSGRDTVM